MNDHITRIYYSTAYSCFVIAAGTIALSICVLPIARDLGLNLTQSGALSAFGSIVQLVGLIITPFLACKLSKVFLLQLGGLLLAIGFLLVSFSYSYIALLGSFFFFGCGGAILEAFMTPIVQDLYPTDDGSKMNVLHSFWPMGICFTVLIVGFLLSHMVSWRLIYRVLSFLALLSYFFYPNIKRLVSDGTKKRAVNLKEIFSNRTFWLFAFSLFFQGGSESAFSFWSASLIRLHFNASAFYAGVGIAIYSMGMFLGRIGVAILIKRFGMKKIILLSSMGAFLLCFAFPFITILPFLYVYLFFMGIFLACLWPSIQSYAAGVLPVDATALMIYLSCFGIPGGVFCVFIMGAIGDMAGLFMSFMVMPFFLLGVPLLFFIGLKTLKKTRR